MERVIAGQSLAIQVDFESAEGEFFTPSVCLYTVKDAEDSILVDKEAISPESPTHILIISAEVNALDPEEKSDYRAVTVEYEDELGRSFTRFFHYVIEQTNTVETGVTSFGTMGSMMIQATRMPGMDEVLESEPYQVMRALAGAYFNIGRMSIDLSLNGKRFSSTLDMTSEDIAAMSDQMRQRFIQAQLVEADFLLGGNPVEMRRRMGLLSESVGEVSQFFRTARPLILPVCNECASILSPYTVRVMKLARSG